MLTEIMANDSLQVTGQVAFYKANSKGDDILLYDECGDQLSTLYGIRQQVKDVIHSDLSILRFTFPSFPAHHKYISTKIMAYLI